VSAQQPEKAQGVTVARVLRPQGRRGEVACEILTDFPERLKNLRAAMLWDARPASRAEARPVKIRSCWISQSRGGQAIFHFEGSETISDAEKLVGLDVQIPLAERTALPIGSYYVTDLIGCEIFEKGGAMIGRVRDVQFTGEGVAGTPILVLDSLHGEFLIPLAQEICVHVDVAARRIEVVLPEGLLELNRE
jgi:16S rRNA processing protein RimM